jgi:putative radical SAM enzyme (TIGR03279 family)
MPTKPVKCRPTTARIADIIPGSIAEELALQPGDLVCAVNGEAVSDYIAYRFAIAEEVLTLEIARGTEHADMEIEKDADEDLGIVFAGDVFDGVRSCRNSCVFCFEEQMPAGMRAGLRLRDDDYRLSFLHGNFLTLTNLTRIDKARIIREHLSPLFVSIHATDLAVRRRMLRNPRAGDILTALRELAAGGIDFHGQIVLCPGWNDGETLERTLAELASLHPAMLSIGIVPVGLTGHRPPRGPELRAVSLADAETTLDCVARWQQTFLKRFGTRLVYAADEFYLSLGRDLPSSAEYEGFPQKENGIGLTRQFLDEATALTLPSALPTGKVTLATGKLAAPLIESFTARLRKECGVDVEAIMVPNNFYGGGVSVSGLLTGSDFRAALAERELGRLLLLPASTLNSDRLFLDDMTPAELETVLAIPIRFCAGPQEIVEAIKKR